MPLLNSDTVKGRGGFPPQPFAVPGPGPGEYGYYANEALEQTPGRLQAATAEELTEKPKDSPWHSRLVVLPRNSADGNSYKIGEPIPEAEAIRQGVYDPDAAPVETVLPKRVCPRCKGRGTLSRKRPPNHKDGCPCAFCGPCPVCEGSRYVIDEEQEASV